MADRTIRHSVSWNHLNGLGLVFGKVVDIGGQKYLLRLLQGANVNPASVGGGASSNDEWDSLIVQFTPDTADSHWQDVDPVNSGGNGAYSWCQETTTVDILRRLRRGYSTLSGFSYQSATLVHATIGYRPVLEVL